MKEEVSVMRRISTILAELKTQKSQLRVLNYLREHVEEEVIGDTEPELPVN